MNMQTTYSIDSKLPLNNGSEIPALGLGVWQMARGAETIDSVTYALDAGYRHIDTAKLYRNEESVGQALRQSGLPRESVYVVTKLSPADSLNVEKAFEESLRALALEYVDLYLIHWPVPLMGKAIWRKMESLYDQKLARSIGVSNYGVSLLQETLVFANVLPAVNQVEFNPFSWDPELLEYCQINEIVLEAYSPLNRGMGLDNRMLKSVSKHYDKTPAQVMLRRALQKETAIIPKSSNAAGIKENADIFDFELSESDMAALDELA